MVLTMENALVITPVKKKSGTDKNGKLQTVRENDRLRMQQFKWKMEDSKKRIAEKGSKMSLLYRSSQKEAFKQGTDSTDQAIPICPSIVTSDWKSALRPISYHDQVNMIRSLTDLKDRKIRQPLTTVYVRWQENKTGFIYSQSHLEYIFGHFGEVINVSPQSLCSAHVTFNSIVGACRAISMKNIGLERYPLHVCWLPKAWQNRYWVKKETVPKTFVITNQASPIKRPISHPNQIHCSYYVCSVKGCPNKAVSQF